jgi:LAGLIDADG DNA endonuclease family
MNRQDRGILVGMVLGDGCLRVRERAKGKYKYIQSELRLLHSLKQLAYLEYKVELITRIFGGKATINPSKAIVKGITYPSFLYTKSNKYFVALRRVMYPEGKKTYTKQVLSYLTPHGIAIWYMDDGSANTNVRNDGYVSSCMTRIHTCCSLPEAELVKDYFKEIHDIDVKVMPEKGNFSIRMNTESSQKFARLVAPFIIPEMLYKLAHVANLNVQECRTRPSLCVQCGENTYGNHRRIGLCIKCYTNNRYAEQKEKREDIVRTNANKEALEVIDKEL